MNIWAHQPYADARKIGRGLHLNLANIEVSRKCFGNGVSPTTNSKFYWEYFRDGMAGDFDWKMTTKYSLKLCLYLVP